MEMRPTGKKFICLDTVFLFSDFRFLAECCDDMQETIWPIPEIVYEVQQRQFAESDEIAT